MARRSTKLVIAAAVVLVGYPLLLVVLGLTLPGHVGRIIERRLAESLDGQARVGAVELGLVRGTAAVRGVVVERHHLGGTLTLAIDQLEVDVAPLGAVVVDREPRQVRVRGAHLTISGAGALDLPKQPPHPPIALGAIDVAASDLQIVVATDWPELGQVALRIDHLRAGRTVLRTPLSWVFSLIELDARVELPGDADFAIHYLDGRLSAIGGLFGDRPVAIEIELPRTPGPDEPAQLRALALELGKRLVIARGKAWLLKKALGG